MSFPELANDSCPVWIVSSLQRGVGPGCCSTTKLPSVGRVENRRQRAVIVNRPPLNSRQSGVLFSEMSSRSSIRRDGARCRQLEWITRGLDRRHRQVRQGDAERALRAGWRRELRPDNGCWFFVRQRQLAMYLQAAIVVDRSIWMVEVDEKRGLHGTATRQTGIDSELFAAPVQVADAQVVLRVFHIVRQPSPGEDGGSDSAFRAFFLNLDFPQTQGALSPEIIALRINNFRNERGFAIARQPTVMNERVALVVGNVLPTVGELVRLITSRVRTPAILDDEELARVIVAHKQHPVRVARAHFGILRAVPND